MAAPTYVQSKSNGSTASATTIAATMDSSIAAGNLIAVWVGWEDANINPTVSNGTSNLTAGTRAVQGGAYGQWFYDLSSISGTLTFTANYGSSVGWRGIIVQEFAGSGAWSFDTQVTGAGSGSSLASGAFSTTGTEEVVLGGAKHYSSGTYNTPLIGGAAATFPATWSPETTGFNATWYQLKDATMSSVTAAVSRSSSGNWVCNAIAFKVGGGGGGGGGTGIVRGKPKAWQIAALSYF